MPLGKYNKNKIKKGEDPFSIYFYIQISNDNLQRGKAAFPFHFSCLAKGKLKENVYP